MSHPFNPAHVQSPFDAKGPGVPLPDRNLNLVCRCGEPKSSAVHNARTQSTGGNRG